MFEKVQNIRQNYKIHHESHGQLESGIRSSRINPSRSENPKRHLARRLTLATTIFIVMMPLNYMLMKCTVGLQIYKTIRIYRQDIGMEFGIEKCAMLIKKKVEKKQQKE